MEDAAAHLDAFEVIDVGGRVIAPGFIDIHVHGAGGVDLMDGDPDVVRVMARAHARGGSTAIVPSTTTSSMADLYQALDNVESAKASYRERRAWGGARILGVHLEGPYFLPEQGGAQDPRFFRTPEREEYEKILAYSGNIIRVSAAPELEGALALGSELRRRGILASIGHSNATFEDIQRAVDVGYGHVTHLFSCTSGVRRVNAYRVAGVIESALLLDELTVEIIGDGKHLPASLIKLVYKCKGAERIALVTDAMRAAGMPEGEYHLGSKEDGQKVIVEDGVAKLPDRSAFAGSVATMNLLVKNAMQLGEVPLTEAIKMATTTPARIIGCADTKGSLAPGKDADLVVFEEDSAEVRVTIVEGTIVYNNLNP